MKRFLVPNRPVRDGEGFQLYQQVWNSSHCKRSAAADGVLGAVEAELPRLYGGLRSPVEPPLLSLHRATLRQKLRRYGIGQD